jgi:hypothetical protein
LKELGPVLTIKATFSIILLKCSMRRTVPHLHILCPHKLRMFCVSIPYLQIKKLEYTKKIIFQVFYGCKSWFINLGEGHIEDVWEYGTEAKYVDVRKGEKEDGQTV